MNQHEYSDLEIIEYELDITGKSAERLLYNFRKKMNKTGISLMECIADYKQDKIENDRRERFRNGFNKTTRIIYKTILFLVVSFVIYLSTDISVISLFEGQGLIIVGVILFGAIVGAIVGSFWESEHNIFINGFMGIMGSLLGYLFTIQAFTEEDRNFWYYLFSILIATTILLFVFNLIVSFGGLLLTCIIALGFGLSNTQLLGNIFSETPTLVSVLVTSVLFAIIHQKLSRNNFSRFVYLLLVSLIGGIFGVIYFKDKLIKISEPNWLNTAICSIIGSILVVLFAEFVDRQAENAD